MTCYRSGGCGPYENRACNECPASKPSYLSRINNDKNSEIVIKSNISFQVKGGIKNGPIQTK